MFSIKVNILKINPEKDKDIPLPEYKSTLAAGADLRAAIEQPIIFAPGEIKTVPTGLAMEIWQGYEGQVRSRSGLAAKTGLTLVGGIGTIDADYRGEIKVPMINLGSDPVVINRGDRIAQIIFSKVYQAKFEETECLGRTSRGHDGFGSTGVK